MLLLALVAPWLFSRGAEAPVRAGRDGGVGADVATYLAYTVFEDWWYMRFLLPAMPVMLVFTVTVA